MKNLNTFKLLSDYESEKSGVLNTPNVSFVAEDNSVRYLLEYPPTTGTENGYEWVDLGLPSGLKWATCNIGANSPEKKGLYFAWGETTGYTFKQVDASERVFDWDTYKAGSAASISTNLTLEQDAAHVNMSGKWRMPTKTEFEELINSSYTTTTKTMDYNGTSVAGCVITSKTNGNSIFLPTAGYCNNSGVDEVGLCGNYWSSTWDSSSYAYYLNFYYENGINMDNHTRYYGRTVRGVCE